MNDAAPAGSEPAAAAAGDAHPLRSDVRLPSTAHLRAFEAAVRLGSFERASRELSVTASAVSKRVAALETLLDVRLLSRNGNGVEPTPSGREYLQQVSVALGLLTRSSYHRRGTAPQRLRIATPPTFGRDLLVPHLADFSARHPAVELEMTASIPYMDISAPDCDLEIRFGDGDFGGLEGIRLIDEPVFPVASPGYLASVQRLRCPADLPRHATLLRCPLEPWQPWLLAAGLPPVEPCAGHRFVDLGMLQTSALCGQGVALARYSLARQPLAQGRLRRLFEIQARPRFAYYVCWQPQKPPDAVQAAFIDWLQAVCRERMNDDGAAALSHQGR